MKDTSFHESDVQQIAFTVFYCPPTGRILVEHRLSDHTYGIPGGGVDDGEDIASAALREAEEETGHRADKSQLLHLINYPCEADGKSRHCNIFVVVVDEEFEPKITGEQLPPLPRSTTTKEMFNFLYSQKDNKKSYRESHSLEWVKPDNWPEPAHPNVKDFIGPLAALIDCVDNHYMADSHFQANDTLRDMHQAILPRQSLVMNG